MELSLLERITSSDARQRLQQHFPTFLMSLGLHECASEDMSEALDARLSTRRPEVLDEIAAVLHQSRLHIKWKEALAADRAAVLADWIRPYIGHGKMLDLLCGDGAVGMRIAEGKQLAVDLVEREGQKGVVARPWTDSILSYERFLLSADSNAQYDTVLLCTVLHHEIDPTLILDLAAQLGRRVIVIENCVEEMYSSDYHLLVDAIFNCSLYKTLLASPGEHCTVSEWRDLCRRYGSVQVVESSLAIPGIPLPHSMLIVEVN